MSDDEQFQLPPVYFFKKGEFTLDPEHPWRNDKLDRRRQAETIWSILQHVEQPIVMTLSAPFGKGKTTFLKCWRQELTNQGVQNVIHNAWEHDFSSDAFAAFVSSIEGQLPQRDEVRKKFVESATQLGSAILKAAPGFAAKMAAKHLIGEEAAKSLKSIELSEEELAELAEGIALDAFQAEKDMQSAVIAFRSKFEKIIEEYCDGKLIVFVDELDRCRPTYAVEILERIKHIFSVKGAIFVLAVDKQQMLNCISGVYGNKLEAENYFKKFVDWQYRLPEPYLLRYIRFIFQDFFAPLHPSVFDSNDNYGTNEQYFIGLIYWLARAKNLSLRDIDQYFSYLGLVFKSGLEFRSSVAVGLAVFLKLFTLEKSYFSAVDEIENQRDQTEIETILTTIINLETERDVTFSFSTIKAVRILLLMLSVPKDDYEQTAISCVSKEFFDRHKNKLGRINYDWLMSVLCKERWRDPAPSVGDALTSINFHGL